MRCIMTKKLLGFLLVILLPTLVACSPAKEKVWIPGWKETSPMNITRAGSAEVVVGKFIYMIAGVDGRHFLRSTEYAEILPNGQLGKWKMGTPLVVERGFTEAVADNGYIYVVGGGNGPNGEHLLQSAERAKINPDGSLGPWRLESNKTNLPRRCTKLALINHTLYSFGGFGGVLLDSVEYSKIADDGSLGKWQMASENMTMPRYVDSVKSIDGVAYVFGGHDQQKGVGIKDVEWAKPQSNGDIRGWKKTSPMNNGRYGLTSAKHHKTIYAIGGLSGLEYLSSIEKATVLASGGLSAWKQTTPLSSPRSILSAVTHNDHIYILGGTNRDGYTRMVEYADINKDGDIGFWGSEQERTAYQAHLKAQKKTGLPLPNEGVIQQVLQTQMYSYLEVLTQGRKVWLACPKTKLPVNTRIRYSKGVYMSNFYSKELQRPFPAVTFVSRIEAVQ
jgi:hypothetical protein